MPYKEKEIVKKYYLIGEVATMFNIYPSAIRFYEKEFDIKPKRTKEKENRIYQQKDIEQLKTVLYLIEVAKFSIKGAKQWIAASKALPTLPVECLDSRALKYQLLLKAPLPSRHPIAIGCERSAAISN